ncbi:CopG family transcriptional regulator [Pseudahrensia aquimaris]|uniref:CopG family transcriptional regulator n=1 Tax=Pseudahrensia aquimaris TaxID=744461 RepID=A0ABW3FHK4_9HYPH
MMEGAYSSEGSRLNSTFQSVSVKRKSVRNHSPRVTLRLTEEELDRLKRAAAGVSISAYIRKQLFGDQVSLRKTRSRVPVKNQKALAQVLGKLGETRISNNLNQIAYEANCGSLLMDQQTEEELKIACAHIAWMRVKLIEALGLKGSQEG